MILDLGAGIGIFSLKKF